MIRGGARPQSARASESRAAAKAVRTATKLSYGANRALRGRILAGQGQQEQGNRPIPAATQPFSVLPATPTPPLIPPDLLLGTIQKLRPSRRRPCRIDRRIAKKVPPHIQAKYAAGILTRAMRPGAGPSPIRRLPRHLRPHRVVLQIPQKHLKSRANQARRIETRSPVDRPCPPVRREHLMSSPTIQSQRCQ